MTQDFLIFDEALSHVDAYRSFALTLKYDSMTLHHGVSYPLISKSNNTETLALLREKTGLELELLNGAFRLNQPFYPNPTWVHQDSTMGEYTSILYLNPINTIPAKTESGTSFFSNKRTGKHEFSGHEDDLTIKRYNAESLMGDKWRKRFFVPGLYNRLLFFKSSLFHAMEPKDGFGSEMGSSRLIEVGFYKVTK